MWKAVVASIAIPLLVLTIAFIFELPVLPTASPTLSNSWTILGTFLSYVGVLFSAYAAYAVRDLSKRYFAKARFRDIQEQLTQITNLMVRAATKRAIELRAEKFMSQVPVVLGEVERTPGHAISKTTEKARQEFDQLIGWINKPGNINSAGNTSTIYWDLFRRLNQVLEEIKSHLKEQEAR